MKTLWIGLAVSLASPLLYAETIYKLVDESGRVTYANRPMKGAVVLELEPLSTIPNQAGPALQGKATGRAAEKTAMKPDVATVTPRAPATTVASIDRETQRGRDGVRRRILEEELAQEEKSLADARQTLLQEQQNPMLVAAVRVAQQAVEPTPSQQAQMRADIDRASGRIRGLQSIVSEHEKNIEALKKELGAQKP